MRSISIGRYVMIGLLFWGLPAIFVAGPAAVLYTAVAILPVWLLCRRSPAIARASAPIKRYGITTAAILAVFAFGYLVADALFGQKLLQFNLFLFGNTAVERVVDSANLNVSEGRGAAALLGTILGSLPFCLIDVAGWGPRIGRGAIWACAILLLFYGVTTSRGAVLISVMTIVMGRTSNWKRILFAAAIAFGLFTIASVVRGDYGNTSSPLWAAIAGPYINLYLMLTIHCGSAPWSSYVFDFFKKFIPGFLFPKTVYSFNIETSLCIYPTADNAVAAVSIFTWLGEIFYYTPSIVTALCAGILLGGMSRIVDKLLVRNQLPTARISIGLACIVMLRSRSLDVLSFLIAQWIFLLFWPHLYRLARYLRGCVASPTPASNKALPQQEGS
jgi:hypothetical protein